MDASWISAKSIPSPIACTVPAGIKKASPFLQGGIESFLPDFLALVHLKIPLVMCLFKSNV